MPKTAIDKYGDLAPWKGDIGDTTRVPQNLIVDTIPETDSVHLLAQCHFWPRALLPDLRHTATDIRRRGIRFHHETNQSGS